MDTRQIDNILRYSPITSKVFRGVFSVDNIKSQQGPGIYVCNTDPSDRPGKHWIVIGIPPENSDRVVEYFDSFGFPPQQQEFVDFLNNNTTSSSSWIYNTERIQHPLSTVCGHYCVLYAFNFAQNKSMAHFIARFDTKKVFENDIMVHERGMFARMDIPLIDVNMIVNQLGY